MEVEKIFIFIGMSWKESYKVAFQAIDQMAQNDYAPLATQLEHPLGNLPPPLERKNNALLLNLILNYAGA